MSNARHFSPRFLLLSRCRICIAITLVVDNIAEAGEKQLDKHTGITLFQRPSERIVLGRKGSERLGTKADKVK